ncbi:lung seven transmembrane receptor-domain-containing protein [Coprinopsis sp. MPI-PUGE-AT-0042]|nr:lung seven transmembrane receptor-domain-containing protein [Coprinopsis sp. MPI-PUGE-AT-0042]
MSNGLSPARCWYAWFWLAIGLLVPSVLAYETKISDKEYARQSCSGMWGGPSAYINVTFDKTSQGQVAMIIYEWADEDYLGKERQSSETFEDLPRVFICTTSALNGGYCKEDQLGRFILTFPDGKKVSDSSIWSARVELPEHKASREPTSVASSGFWNNPPNGSFPTPPASQYDAPWKRGRVGMHRVSTHLSRGEEHTGLYTYDKPIHYPVTKTGYYCVAIVPLNENHEEAATDPKTGTTTGHPPYSAAILFKNTFDGKLPATDYPKVTFYFAMFLAYAAIGAVWGWFCYQHLQDLLPIQYYLSGLFALLVVEMLANWVYYRYLNAHGRGTASTAFLIVVAILDAGRNSMSFFMLLVVALGLSVVRESLGVTMRKCQALAVAHFIFGILYAIGIVELELESTSALILLLFIIPLAFTLSAFLLWIMHSLNATIQQLRARKQRFKLRMFTRLNYILIFSVIVIAAFFVVSSMSFSGRLAEDYAANSWKSRWWLLDGWLALLYFVCFSAIAFLWRPSENNRRLAMSDEIAQDEEEAEDYDLQALQNRSQAREDDDDDAATLVGGRRGPGDTVSGDVVFEIGDEDEDDEEANKKARPQRLSGEGYQAVGGRGEREGLMNRDD